MGIADGLTPQHQWPDESILAGAHNALTRQTAATSRDDDDCRESYANTPHHEADAAQRDADAALPLGAGLLEFSLAGN